MVVKTKMIVNFSTYDFAMINGLPRQQPPRVAAAAAATITAMTGMQTKASGSGCGGPARVIKRNIVPRRVIGMARTTVGSAMVMG
jgi:hypothetical protein